MIVQLEGKLLEATPLSAVVSCQGVGYELHVPVTTAEKLPTNGETVRLYTQAVYREDSQALYGFHAREDRDAFRLIVEKVSGVGPRTALNLLSRYSASQFRDAIAAQDIAGIAKTPGIGRKTAEKMILELKDKLPSELSLFAPAASSAKAGASADAQAALMALGYKAAEAEKSVARALKQLGEDADTESLIKAALGN